MMLRWAGAAACSGKRKWLALPGAPARRRTVGTLVTEDGLGADLMSAQAASVASRRRRQAGPIALTLDRGLKVLEVLAQEPGGLRVTQLARAVGTHRTNLYRVLLTLARHRLVRRDWDGRYVLGLGLVELVRGVACDLRSVALPVLERLAHATQATAFVAVADGDEVVIVAVAEPKLGQVYLACRPGWGQPLRRGAAGLAILAGRPPVPGEGPEVKRARARGYAVTFSEPVRGLGQIAAPIRVGSRPAEASIGLVTIGEPDPVLLAPHVVAAADAITQALS
jgi:DNA-binding IclR family transcriptional regulator